MQGLGKFTLRSRKLSTGLVTLCLGLAVQPLLARPQSIEASSVIAQRTKAESAVGAADRLHQVSKSALDLIPSQIAVGQLELVASFMGAAPTGVTVSQDGRIFVCFPRRGAPCAYTVGEVIGGKTIAYPNEEINKIDRSKVKDNFVSVQSVVIDPRGRLWILDTGSADFRQPMADAPKLVCVDLADNKVVERIGFPQDVVLPTTYLNDVRFDLSRGKGGMAFISDSSSSGPNGIIVVDLAKKTSWRRLNGHASTRPVPGFVAVIEGAPLIFVSEGGQHQSLKIGVNGIALGADGKSLFYCPLSSRKLFSVSIDALCDEKKSDTDVANTVCEVVEKGASDGLESDSLGRIYATDFEHNAVRRISLSGGQETIVCNPHLLWPDSLCLAGDGYLYITTSQLHRQPRFHSGKDLRQKPYALFRVKVGAQPVLLR